MALFTSVLQSDVGVDPSEVLVKDAVEGHSDVTLGSPATLSRFAQQKSQTGATPTGLSALHLPMFPDRTPEVHRAGRPNRVTTTTVVGPKADEHEFVLGPILQLAARPSSELSQAEDLDFRGPSGQ